MPKLTQRPAVLRDSWNNKNDFRSGRYLKLIKLAALMMASVGLMSVFFYLLADPVWHPNTHLILISGGQSESREYAPSNHGSNDLEQLLSLKPSLQIESSELADDIITLQSQQSLEELSKRLEELSAQSRDVLIVYVSAHGFVVDGQAFLVCQNFDSTQAGTGRVSIAKFINIVAANPASTKLILFESGQHPLDARLGQIGSRFPDVVCDELQKNKSLRDKNIWVLGSCDSLQHSLVSGRDGHTAFGYFVGKGLQGSADLNHDGFIRLNELFRYVQGSVLEFSTSESFNLIQTPFLCATGATEVLSDPIILPVNPLVLQTNSSNGDSTDPTTDPAAIAEQENATTEPGNLAVATDSEVSADSTAGEDENETTKSKKNDGLASVSERSVIEDQLILQQPMSGEMRKKLEKAWDEAYGSLATLQREVWDLYFQFERLGTFGQRPMDYAPSAWRELGELIMDYDFQARKGDSPSEITERLSEIVTALKALKSGQVIPDDARNEVIERVVASKPSRVLNFQQLYSMGLAQNAEAIGFAVLDSSLSEKIVQFDGALSETTNEKLKTWLTKNSQLQQMYEPWLARRLLDTPNLSWELVQRAITLSRFAEGVGCSDISNPPWIQEHLETADRIRFRSLALIEDQTVPRWSRRAAAGLEQARKLYELAAEEIQVVENARRLRNDLILRLAYYLRVPFLERTVKPGAIYRELNSLVNATIALDSILNDLKASNLPSLKLGIQNSVTAHEKFWMALLPSASLVDKSISAVARGTVDLETLVNIPVFRSVTRSRLLLLMKNRPSLEETASTGELIPDVVPQLSSLDQNLLRGTRRHIELEIKFAKLAELKSDRVSSAPSELQAAYNESFGKLQDDPIDEIQIKNWSDASLQMNAALAEFYQGLPRRVNAAFNEYQNPEGGEAANKNLTWLRNVWRAAYLIDARDSSSVDGSVVVTELFEALCFNWLSFYSQRLALAAQNQTRQHRNFFADWQRQFQRAARQLRPQFPEQPVRNELVELTGIETVSFASGPTGYVEVTCKYLGREPGKIWLFVDYNSDNLVVSGSQAQSVYDLNELRKSQKVSLSVLDLEGVLDPQAMTEGRVSGLDATFDANPGESRQFRFRLNPQPDATDSKFVVSAATSGQVVRHETTAKIQAQSDWELVVRPRQSEVSYSQRNSVYLHPLPNRAADYMLLIRNRSNRERVVSFQLLAPPAKIETPLPAGDISASELQRQLGLLGKVQVLHQTPPWSVPADEDLRPIPMSGPETGEEAKEVLEEGNEPSNISVRHGILAVLTDAESMKSRIWQFEFLPQQPQRFLSVEAGYDLASERIEIRVISPRGNLVPAEGHQIVCELQNPLPALAQARLRGQISPSNPEVELFAEVVPSVGRIETVFVHVDDYPRAFIVHVPCWKTVKRIKPSTTEMRFAIVKPVAQQSYKAPTDSIPVQFQVDAPVGAFDDPNNLIQLGIDADRDRELSKEKTVEFHSDRQAEIWFLGILPNGRVSTDNRVSDFRVNLPAIGYLDSRVNLLGRILVGTDSQWSNSVEVLFDSKAPVVEDILLEPGAVVASDDELKVRIVVNDDEMSGVSSVSLGLANEEGEVDEQTPMVAAVKQQDNSWLSVVPLEKVPLGARQLKVRATDIVGNQSELFTKQFKIVSAEEMAANQDAETFSIRGRVFYYGDSISDAKAELTGADGETIMAFSEENGNFLFTDLSPGEYQLVVSSVIRNKPRFFRDQMSVGPGNKENQSLVIKLE